MSEENLCRQSSAQFSSTELEHGCADSQHSVSADLCRIDSEGQISSNSIHFDVEFAETVVLYNAKTCTTVSDAKNGRMHLEMSVSEADNYQSDMFGFGCGQNFSNHHCFDRNPKAECNGDLWEIDNIEDHLEKFVSEEVVNDVSVQVFQNSDEFNNGENTSLKAVAPDELDSDSANECCHIPSSSATNFSDKSPVNVTNSCGGMLGSLFDGMTDHCYSKRVARQFSFHDEISELCHLQSLQNNCLQTLDSSSKDAYTQRIAEENLEHVQFEVTSRVDDTNGGLPAEQCSHVVGNLNNTQRVGEENLEHVQFEVTPKVDDTNGGLPVEQCSHVVSNREYFVSDSVVEWNSENAVSQTCGSNTVCAAECSSSLDLDLADKVDQSPDESFLVEQLSSVKDVRTEGLLLNQVQENSSVSKFFASNNLMSACQSTSLSGSNCALWSNSTEIIEDSVPTSLITDSSVVSLGTLLQSADCMVSECPFNVSSSKGITKPLDKVNNLVNEKVQEVIANGSPADGQISDCEINDVVGKIKKEEPRLSDDGTTCAGDWKEPLPYGLQQCFCPHGYVSPTVGHFHCQECGISSRFRSRVINHEVAKHRVKHLGVKFFSCSQCICIFTCARRLRRHVKKHHSQAADGKTEDMQSGSDLELCESECGSMSPMHAKGRCSGRLSALVSRAEMSSEMTRQHLESPKRKSDEPARTNFKKFKPGLDQVGDKSIPEEYKVTSLTAGKIVTACRPAYDGPLLPVLLKPTSICEVCGQRFASNKVQSQHYAQVHRLYLKGISVFQCTACKYRTTHSSDYKAHIRTERHRIAASKEIEQNLSPGEALLTDDGTDAWHKDIICGTKKKKWKPYSLRKIVNKPFVPSKSRKVLGSVGRKVTRDNCSKTDSIVKDNFSGFADQKLKIEVSKCYPYKKINKFFSLLTRDAKERRDCSNFNDPFPSKTAANACVTGHVCKRECICGFDLRDETASDIGKQSCVRSELDDKRSSGSTAVVSCGEFNPVIVESYSCVPSTWSNTPDEKELADLPSTPKSTGRMELTKTKLNSNPNSFSDSKMRKIEDDRPCSPRSVSATAGLLSARKPTERVNLSKPELESTSLSFYDKGTRKTEDNMLSSRSISTTARGFKFYQNTRDSLLTSVVAQYAKPTSTCEDNVPASKFQTPVTVERSSPHVGKESPACKDPGNLVVIQVSDEESESSNSSTFTASSNRRVKTKQTVSSSSADPLRPGSVNSSVSGKACSLADIIELDDDSDDDGDVATESRSKTTATVSSESSRPTEARYDKDAPLSEFSSEVLFSELRNRSFVTLCHCGVYFLSSDIYNLHCAWHLDGDLLKCNFCSADNKDWYEFYSHILNHSK